MLPTWHDAAERLKGVVLPRAAVNRPVDGGLVGMVLARKVAASSANPRFRMSAMDGWAIHANDMAEGGVAGVKVASTVLAGMSAPRLLSGTSCAVMTGAPVPMEAGAVVPVEDAHEEQGVLTWNGSLALGQNIREEGEDFRDGQVVLDSGVRLGPQHLVLLRTAGVATVDVYQDSSVALIQTGDELAEGPEAVKDAAVFESTRDCLVAILRRLGVSGFGHQRVRDEKGALQRAIERALQEGVDLILTTGGVSKGVADHVPEVVKSLGGDILLHRLAIKPAKPLLVARFPSGAILIGLPGNPVSQLLAFQAVVMPLLEGRPLLKGMDVVQATLLEACQGKETFRTFIRGVAEISVQGQLVVRPLGGNESHRVGNLAVCNAWLHVTGPHAPGSLIEVSPFMDTQWRFG